MSSAAIAKPQPYTSLLQSLPSSSEHPLRPLLTHLNPDTTWLLSIPIPQSAPNSRRRKYHHVLIDPWLSGPQSDVVSWFSIQWHSVPSAFPDVASIDRYIRGLEGKEEGQKDKNVRGEVDSIVISHEFTDHMHKETLLTLSSEIPVFATKKAYDAIVSWKHFNCVCKIERYSPDTTATEEEEEELGGSDGQKHSVNIPSWLLITRLAYPGNDALYYHSAILITFSSLFNTPSSQTQGQNQEQGQQNQTEGVIYTPHGITPSNLTPLLSSSSSSCKPSPKILALLHGLDAITLSLSNPFPSWLTTPLSYLPSLPFLPSFGAQLNLGAKNGLEVVKALDVRYWVGTHDEVKNGGGIVAWFLGRERALDDILAELGADEEGKDGKENGRMKGEVKTKYIGLGNGEGVVLV